MFADFHRARRRFLYTRRVNRKKVNRLQTSLLGEAQINLSYLVLIFGSCAIASFGLLSNSAAVIIGAMIIAPLMLPIRCMAFGILEGEGPLIRQGIAAILVGTGIAIAMASLIGLMSGIQGYGSEILARAKPNLLDLGVAVVAGGISGFAKVQPKLSSTLAGTAIAVALMPPLCVVGLGLAQAISGGARGFDIDLLNGLELSRGAGLLYLTNLLGITLSCMVAFWLAGYTPLVRARRGLGLGLAATSILVFPLGFSFFQLVEQSRLEASLRRALLDKTMTFQQVQLISSETNWFTDPPQVRLVVSSREPVSPKQVRLLEEFLGQEMERPFKLVFEITQLEEVERQTTLPGGGR